VVLGLGADMATGPGVGIAIESGAGMEIDFGADTVTGLAADTVTGRRQRSVGAGSGIVLLEGTAAAEPRLVPGLQRWGRHGEVESRGFR